MSLESRLPLWIGEDANRPIAWRAGAPVLLREFARHVAMIADVLPGDGAMINLCEDRYRFLAAYAAALSKSHTVLLPASRAEQIVADVHEAHAGSYRCDDSTIDTALAGAESDGRRFNDSVASPSVAHDHVAMIGFTSGSTGQPRAYPKLWRSVHGSNACNAEAMRSVVNVSSDAGLWIVATVPPQHMYGMELTVLLPLIGGMAVHSSRPLFPADIAATLNEVPEPRVLVSTPVHLRALVESDLQFPRTALIVSATAPLDATLAAQIEEKLGGHLLEMFGSTETCVFARRRTALRDSWRPYPGVELRAAKEGTLVNAPWFVTPTSLQDVLELQGDGRFTVRGRNTDLIEVAGKRGSLTDLTRRLHAIEGVKDAVVFQPEGAEVATIRRVAALVVAPGVTARFILERLAPGVDPAFLPRPLLLVDSLPRNELGKLPREALMQMLMRK